MTKKIEAIIRTEKLEDVKTALHQIGIVGMNVVEIRGHGRQGGIKLSGRNGDYTVDLLPRLQVNIVLSDHNLDKAVEAIRASAATGSIGDGLIFVYPVEDVIRIRTGERGREALHYAGDIDEKRERLGEAIGDKAGAEPIMDDILEYCE
ncbi:MAG: P-II family nitrogen regulator [Anaerolineales bacterium]|nr:P-II family nitrogen regulator [Anaerolineales bacterium]